MSGGNLAGMALAGGVVLAIVGQLNGWWCGAQCRLDAEADRRVRIERLNQTPPPAVRPPPATPRVDHPVDVAGHREHGHRRGYATSPQGRGTVYDSGVCRPCPEEWFRRPIGGHNGHCNCSR